jgi:hypothetical protein
MSNHTPTPWSTSGDLIVGAPEAVPNPQVAPYPKQVAKLQWDYEGDSGATERRIHWPEAAANAALIVRAVNSYADLLDACRLMLKCDEYSPDWHVPEAIEAARAAIAKATE